MNYRYEIHWDIVDFSEFDEQTVNKQMYARTIVF